MPEINEKIQDNSWTPGNYSQPFSTLIGSHHPKKQAELSMFNRNSYLTILNCDATLPLSDFNQNTGSSWVCSLLTFSLEFISLTLLILMHVNPQQKYTLTVLGLQLSDCRSWVLAASIVSELIPHDKSLSMYAPISSLSKAQSKSLLCNISSIYTS